MTITSTGRIRHSKTNPDCKASRHGPVIQSWKRGCICPGSEQAMLDWAQAEASRGCAAESHAPTDTSWRHGCRHVGAVVAHERWKAKLRGERATALRIHRKTGSCGAVVHGTIGAYRRGCRCPDAVKVFQESHDGRQIARLRSLFGSTGHQNPWREGKMAVSRINLWMLVHGFVDRPTVGERMAAVAILSQRGATGGGLAGGFLDNQQIAARLGINDMAVIGIRKRMAVLAETRAQRRLADVRAKAVRVERARSRA